MRNFFEWFNDEIVADRPWLIIGKGPSFDYHPRFNLDQYYTLGLNHVVDKLPVFLAHIKSLDIVADCKKSLRMRNAPVILPFHPHVNDRPGRANIDQICKNNFTLELINRQGNLLTYNNSLIRKQRQHSHLRLVKARPSSAAAAVNLLGEAGVKEIYTLGIDGGSQYSPSFSTHSSKNFDNQFEEIKRSVKLYGLQVQPLVPGHLHLR